VNDVYLIGIGVEENEEWFSDEIQLHDGFCDGEGFEGYFFAVGDDLVGEVRFYVFILLFAESGDLNYLVLNLSGFANGSGLVTIDARFVFEDLFIDFVEGGIEGGIHIVGGMFRIYMESVCVEIYLGNVSSVLDIQNDIDIDYFIEMFTYFV
jgi:hypothetical protein